MMRKRYVVSALGFGVAGYLLGTKKNNKQESVNEPRDMEEDLTLYNAGKPDQVDDLELDQLENAKMVSEGSQFGVQYYNNLKADE